jgi:ribosomal protein L28
MQRALLLLTPRKLRMSPKGELSVFNKYGLLHGVRILSGHTSSWSGNRNLRKWHPSITVMRLFSDSLGRHVVLAVSAEGLKAIRRQGGLDNYVLEGFKNSEMRTMLMSSETAVRLHAQLVKQNAQNEAWAQIDSQAYLLASWIKRQSAKGREIPLTLHSHLGTFMHPKLLINETEGLSVLPPFLDFNDSRPIGFLPSKSTDKTTGIAAETLLFYARSTPASDAPKLTAGDMTHLN